MTQRIPALNETAYAVIDETGTAKFSPEHDVYARYMAYKICRARKRSAFPLHPGAKWKVVKVKVTT